MKLYCITVLVTLLCITFVNAKAYNWSSVDIVLKNAVSSGAFPGCVAIVGNEQGYLYAKGVGNFTYGIPPPLNFGINPPMQLNTMFDMASCSKVIAATTAVAQFYQKGIISLYDPVAKYLGPTFTVNGKAGIAIINLLLHNAGFPPDPTPNYWDPKFGCPQTNTSQPQENWSCLSEIHASLLNQSLINPIGAVYIYSDLSYMTLCFVVGYIARVNNFVTPADLIAFCPYQSVGGDICYFEAYVRKYVFQPLGMNSTSYLPPVEKWPNCAPTENDTTYLNRVIQGQVSDGNAFAIGGIFGHAGVFSTAPDFFTLMHRILFATPNDSYINTTTAALFIKEYNHSQSSRALGWNTNDPTVFDEGWNNSCGALANTTFMHLGYTGTQSCGDPVRKIITIFLTNRVYPSAANYKIERVRQLFNNAVASIIDSGDGRLVEDEIQHYITTGE